MTAALEHLKQSRMQLQAVLQRDAQTSQTTPGGTTGLLLKTLLQPLADRKPMQLVLSAFAVGAVLAWGRPWRWLAPSALLYGMSARTALHNVVTKFLMTRLFGRGQG